MPTPLPDNLSSLAPTPLLSYTFFSPHAFMSHASASSLTVHCNPTYILYFYSPAWPSLQKTDSQNETSSFARVLTAHEDSTWNYGAKIKVSCV